MFCNNLFYNDLGRYFGNNGNNYVFRQKWEFCVESALFRKLMQVDVGNGNLENDPKNLLYICLIINAKIYKNGKA